MVVLRRVFQGGVSYLCKVLSQKLVSFVVTTIVSVICVSFFSLGNDDYFIVW